MLIFRAARPLVAVLALLGAPAARAAAVRLTATPVPGWVEPIEVDLSKSSAPRSQHGTEGLLLETQTRFGPRQRAHYVHYADRVTSAEGLDQVAPLRMQFDSTYQQIGVHFVRAWRGGRAIDVLRDATVKVTDVENDLDRRLFDGRRSVVIVPRDLREGDVLEVAFTITGANPVFGGHAMGELSLGGGPPVRRLRARLVVQPGVAPLKVRLSGGAPEPTRHEGREGREFLWDLADGKDVEYEDRTPSWVDTYPAAEWSDFVSWDAVRDWALPLYPPRTPTPAMSERVREWTRANAGGEDRVLAALRFVQDDIRYLGFETGPNSHAPHLPDRVFAQRFGDCKDKSYLLVTLLRAMGVEANPALVDTTSDGQLDRALPSPFAFNHVIVRAALDGRTYWLDPTLSQQGGTLKTQSTPRYGHALVLDAKARGLERVPEDPITSPLVSLNERYEVEHDGAASLEIETTYRQSSADWARTYFTDAPPERLTRRFVNFYAKRHPSITVVESARVSDNRRGNQVVVRETYNIPRFWQDDEMVLRGHLIDDYLQEPSVRLRKRPLSLSYPVRSEHNVEVLLPTIFTTEALDDKIERDGVAFHRTVKRSGRLVSMHYTFATTARHLDAANVPKHLATLEAVGNRLDWKFWMRGGPSTQKTNEKWDAVIAIGFLIAIFGVPVALFLGGRRLYRRARKRALRRRYEPTAGETAGAAIAIASLDDVSAAGARLRCTCGGHMARPESAPLETSRLGDQEVHSARFLCDRCGRARPIYFKLDVAPPGDRRAQN